MALADAQAYYDPIGGETVGYITPQDAKNAVAQTYADFSAADGLKADLTYVNTQLGLKVNKSGDTMSGPLSTTTPTDGAHATNKTYVDSGLNLKLNLAGGTMTGALTLSGDPTLSNHAANKAYVDLRAPLASPALTGTPTAPTAAVGTNTTQIATTAFVNSEIANDAPTKTGTGASGTWSINITGSAGSASNATTVASLAVHAGRNNEANKIVRTDGSGYLQTGYINSSNGDEGNYSAPARVWGTNGSDSYLRSYRAEYLTNHGHSYAAVSHGSHVSNLGTSVVTTDGNGNAIIYPGVGFSLPYAINGDYPAHQRAPHIHSWANSSHFYTTNQNASQALRLNWQVY